MKKIIIILSILILLPIGFHLLSNKKYVFQDFSITNHKIGVKYDATKFNLKQGEGDYSLGFQSGINLKDVDNLKNSLGFSYEYQNNGDDTPYEAGDTGGGLWPPQPEDLLFDYDENKLIYLGKYLGQPLYISEISDNNTFSVYQKIGEKFTSNLSILNQNQTRPNYNASLFIQGKIDPESKNKKRIYKKFIRILKSMKITSIKKPE